MNTQKLAEESRKLVSDIQSGKFTHYDILTKMTEMDIKFPGIGWTTERDKLKAHWQNQDKIKPMLDGLIKKMGI